jgi:citrate lyase beta subunit
MAIDSLIYMAETRRQALLETTSTLKTSLPLRFFRQQAHYTTPASNYKLAHSAATRGFEPALKIFARYNITFEDLAEALEVPLPAVEAFSQSSPRAPLVMLDGEDAQALDDTVVAQGRQNAVDIFRQADWGGTLRFYRPSGLALPYCVEDLVRVLSQAGSGRPAEAFPIDGIIFPKLEHGPGIDWVCSVLDELEARLGLEANSIKLQFLVESGWSVMNLPELVQRSLPRLAGIIFGIADYTADLRLPEIRYDHPVCDWARAAVVNSTGAAGVPAIDAMTVNYPVTDAALSATENRQRILDRLRECYQDTLHSIDLGMNGKWVGHPAQLFVVLLAYHLHLSSGVVRAEVDKIRAYQTVLAEKVGATIIGGVMSDRATDRHARARLRQAVALGLLSPQEALALGIISEEEAAGMKGDSAL